MSSNQASNGAIASSTPPTKEEYNRLRNQRRGVLKRAQRENNELEKQHEREELELEKQRQRDEMDQWLRSWGLDPGEIRPYVGTDEFLHAVDMAIRRREARAWMQGRGGAEEVVVEVGAGRGGGWNLWVILSTVVVVFLLWRARLLPLM